MSWHADDVLPMLDDQHNYSALGAQCFVVVRYLAGNIMSSSGRA